MWLGQGVVGLGGGLWLGRRTVPVVDQVPEHASCLPPVVGVRQVTGHIARVVAGVVLHHPVRHRAGRALDRVGARGVQREGIDSQAERQT